MRLRQQMALLIEEVVLAHVKEEGRLSSSVDPVVSSRTPVIQTDADWAVLRQELLCAEGAGHAAGHAPDPRRMRLRGRVDSQDQRAVEPQAVPGQADPLASRGSLKHATGFPVLRVGPADPSCAQCLLGGRGQLDQLDSGKHLEPHPRHPPSLDQLYRVVVVEEARLVGPTRSGVLYSCCWCSGGRGCDRTSSGECSTKIEGRNHDSKGWSSCAGSMTLVVLQKNSFGRPIMKNWSDC